MKIDWSRIHWPQAMVIASFWGCLGVVAWRLPPTFWTSIDWTVVLPAIGVPVTATLAALMKSLVAPAPRDPAARTRDTDPPAPPEAP